MNLMRVTIWPRLDRYSKRMLDGSNRFGLCTTVSRSVTMLAGVTVAAMLMVVPTTAAAQNAKEPIRPQSIPASTPAPSGLSVNVAPRFNRGFETTNVPQFDLPTDAVGSTLFTLDLSDTACLDLSDSCGRDERGFDLGLTKSILSDENDGIDLILRPRASLRFDDNSSSAVVGAMVEIGENLRDGSDFKSNTWYLFAGADAEALTYSPDGFSNFYSGNFHLQDRIIVGDAQAGLGYRIGDADVSLSYTRREAQAEDFSYTEDAAALSFTWKR